MEWTVIKLDNISGKHTDKAFVTITKSNGMFNFSAGVSDLLPDARDYKYVQFLMGVDNSQVQIAVRFYKKDVEDALKIKRSDRLKSFVVYSTGMMKKYFSQYFSDDSKKATFPVKKIDDNTIMLVR